MPALSLAESGFAVRSPTQPARQERLAVGRGDTSIRGGFAHDPRSATDSLSQTTKLRVAGNQETCRDCRNTLNYQRIDDQNFCRQTQKILSPTTSFCDVSLS